jgi:hypothetical protein
VTSVDCGDARPPGVDRARQLTVPVGHAVLEAPARAYVFQITRAYRCSPRVERAEDPRHALAAIAARQLQRHSNSCHLYRDHNPRLTVTALPTDPLYSARLRISRAQEHIKSLEAQIDQFFARNSDQRVVEPDPSGTHKIYKLRFAERFPIHWRLLATEIIEHLRASLDHATFATFYLATGRLDSSYAAFPFGKTPTDLDNSVRGRSKDLRPEIQALLRSFDAYKGGNDLLYSLNELCNISKHGLFAFIVGAAAEMEIRGSGDMSAIQFPENLVWDNVKNEIEYARAPLGVDFQGEGRLRVYVAFGETLDSVRNHHAIGLLSDMAAEVDRVLTKIESECRKIGLITR